MPAFKSVFSVLCLIATLTGNAIAQEGLPPAIYAKDRNISYYDATTRESSDAIQASQCRLDIIHPTNRPGFATVVWFHSGGLTAGRRSFPRLQGQEIALVAVGYRFANQGEFPSFLEDAAAATAWVLTNIEKYGGDPTKVFVGGASAGGYLAAMVGMDPRWLAQYGESNANLAGLLLLTGQMTTHFTVKKMRGDTGPDLRPLIDEFAPIYHASNALPPICLITGDRLIEFKNRVEENQLLATVLRNLNHPWVEFHEMGGLDHATVSEAAGIVFRRFIKDVIRKIDTQKPIPELPLVLRDDFSAPRAKASEATPWLRLSGRTPEFSDGEGQRPASLHLDNASVTRTLNQVIHESFVAEVKMRHTAYQRIQWFGLFNESLSHGYIVTWDSSRPDMGTSEGRVALCKVSNAQFNASVFTPKLDWKTIGKAVRAIRPNGDAGQLAVTGPAADLQLLWSKETGQLELRMEGEIIIQTVDQDFSEFSQIVLSGNSTGIFEEVVVWGE